MSTDDFEKTNPKGFTQEEDKARGRLARELAGEMNNVLSNNMDLIFKQYPNPIESLEVFTLVITSIVMTYCENMTNIYGSVSKWDKQDFLDGLRTGIESTWKREMPKKSDNEKFN